LIFQDQTNPQKTAAAERKRSACSTTQQIKAGPQFSADKSLNTATQSFVHAQKHKRKRPLKQKKSGAFFLHKTAF